MSTSDFGRNRLIHLNADSDADFRWFGSNPPFEVPVDIYINESYRGV